jgi:chromosome partitioning protein
LRAFLDKYVDPLDRWDVIVLDMPGVANNITYNGLWAAPNVIAPVSMGGFELKQAQSLESDLATIRETFEQPVELQMVIPNMHDRRTKLHSRKLDEFHDAFGDLLAPEPIVDSQDIREANERGHTLFDVDTDELLSTGEEARDAYELNARELSRRLGFSQLLSNHE